MLNNFKQIREEISQGNLKAQNRLDYYTQRELKAITEDGPAWDVYDSNLESYDNFFGYLPNAQEHEKFGIKQYLKEKFPNRAGDLVGIEVGGIGSKLFQDLNNQESLFKNSIGITLLDNRTEQQKEAGSANNHSVITGQAIGTSEQAKGTKIEIQKQLKGQKADVIIERMEGGILNSSYNPNILFLTLKSWYEQLATPGVMFIQMPHIYLQNTQSKLDIVRFNKLLEEWISYVNLNHPGVLKIYNDPNCWAVMIEKYKDEPLPHLKH